MDKYGPERLMQAYSPSTGSLGLLVVDNTSLGPGLGGFYVLPKITIEHSFELARLYTVMNSLHGVPFGGGCACLAKGERMTSDIGEFASAVAPLANNSFIACPGFGVGEAEMETYAYACGDVRGAAGKPSKLKGIPFENGGVGLGIIHCALEALRFMKIDSPKVSIFGLGRDGLFTARALSRSGARVVAAGEQDGATINQEGLDIDSLAGLVTSGGRADAFPRGNPGTIMQALAEPADLMVIAGHGVINQNIANEIKPRILLEGALGAVGKNDEATLVARGVTVIPDILACGGASLSSHVEYIGGNVVDMNEIVANSMRRTARKVLEEPGRSLREVAERIALERIDEAMKGAVQKG